MCPFFLKDILKLWGAVRSRDLICIILVYFKASILVLCNIFWYFLLHDKPFILYTTPLIFTGKWLLTHALIYLRLFRPSCPVRSPSFPNQKRRNYRWVEKSFGSYQQEQFNLHWENSVSDSSQCIVNNEKECNDVAATRKY